MDAGEAVFTQTSQSLKDRAKAMPITKCHAVEASSFFQCPRFATQAPSVQI